MFRGLMAILSVDKRHHVGTAIKPLPQAGIRQAVSLPAPRQSVGHVTICEQLQRLVTHACCVTFSFGRATEQGWRHFETAVTLTEPRTDHASADHESLYRADIPSAGGPDRRASGERLRAEVLKGLVLQSGILAEIPCRTGCVPDIPDDVVVVLDYARIRAVPVPSQRRQTPIVAWNHTDLTQKHIALEISNVCGIGDIIRIAPAAYKQRVAVACDGVIGQSDRLPAPVELHHNRCAIRAAHGA